ncbi:beta-trefoil DNA-binding domain-containing protein [Dichotomocladium elegans]|nr:beta-trefoil DNA-binding domain-containing protein [Dichotomocladium elegans]
MPPFFRTRSPSSLTSDGKKGLCAKNGTWSPFDIVLVRPPYMPCAMPVTYGTEIILRDTNTGVESPPVVLRKVDKGRITQAFGPISQMQKVALQLASSIGQERPLYLCAHNTHENETHSAVLSSSSSSSSSSSISVSSSSCAPIEFLPSKIIQPDNKIELAYEAVDDYLFWTIVGISKFEYSFHDASLSKQHTQSRSYPVSTISPFPILSSVQYNPESSILNLFGQHLLHLEVWLGSHGPLVSRLVNSQAEQPGSSRQSNHVSVEVPRHLLSPQTIPLFFVRPETEITYHSGKALQFLQIAKDDGTTQRIWTVRLNNWSISE